MYDFLLGGTDNFASDREACARLLRIAPRAREVALANRQFLGRAVKILTAEHGIRQFLDHGSGLPNRFNVHDVAQRIASSSRVVYVDNDPMVLAQARLMLDENERTSVVDADVRSTAALFERVANHDLLDLSRPVAALFVSVLHCLGDADDPWSLIGRVTSRLPAGSFVVACQLASDDPQTRDRVSDCMRSVTGGAWGRVRSFAEVERFFGGLELLETPCEVSAWRPDASSFVLRPGVECVMYGAVARVP